MHYLELGGAETSLIGLLESIDYSRVDVDLFIYAHRGPLMQHIPKQVRLLPEIKEYSLIEAPLKSVFRKGFFRLGTARLKAKLRHKRYLKRADIKPGVEDYSIFGYIAYSVSHVLPDINPYVEYDLAVSFLTPHNYCLDHVRAKRKVAWIHTDYSLVHVDNALETPVWQAFDNIAAVSDDVASKFIASFPDTAGKVLTIENILPKRYISAMSELNSEKIPEKGDLSILSIGRFTYPKNFESIPAIARKIVDKYGIDVRWYIMGYGSGYDLILKCIHEHKMENNVIIIGPRTNPYPWIKACDIYVQPSRYEGKSVTVREAQLLYKPVVITDYPTSSSQINNGVDGIISSPAKLADCIVEVMRNNDLRSKIIDHLSKHDYAFSEQVDKLYTLMS